MSYYEIVDKFSNFDFEGYFDKVTDADVIRSIEKDQLNHFDFLNLLSDNAKKYLEPIARKANALTRQHFGRTLALYIPIYVSNYCTNKCVYCGFNKENSIKRKHLNLEEIEKEAVEIAKTGIKHILLLTGEAKGLVTMDYIEDAVKILKKHFASVAIEIFPMDTEEYSSLKEIGVDGLTVYQETYDKDVYDEVHLAGQKKDYMYRLNTPERGAKAGLRTVNMGTLFGLSEIKREAFFSGMHAKYLMDKYLGTEFSLSLPRINNAEGGFQAKYQLDDVTFVQFMLAYRLFMPKVGINVSTRETAEFRDHLLKLGVTKFSAGSKTSVGGYQKEDESTEQFEISDSRSVEEIVNMIKSKNYQVVYKDWEMIV